MLQQLFMSVILLAGGEGGAGTFLSWDMAARLFNLLLFVSLMIYILRRPLGESLRLRRENIRQELMRAQEERRAALTKLEEVNARLERLDAEVEAIHAQALSEAAAERERIERSTEEEARKQREQAQREIENAAKVARAELRAYVAEQSVRLAEEIIRRDLRPEDDTRLMREYVEDLGGVRH